MASAVSGRLVKELISELPLSSISYAFAYGSGAVAQVSKDLAFISYRNLLRKASESRTRWWISFCARRIHWPSTQTIVS